MTTTSLLKVALINPCSRNRREIQQKCFAPVNLMSLAASLQTSGYNVEIIDANAFNLSHQAVVDEIGRLAPDVVGISLLSEIFMDVFELVTAIGVCRPRPVIVLGGPHANAMPEAVLIDCPGADMVLTGEAEESIVALCRAMHENRPFDGVPGLYYRRAGVVVSNQGARVIEDINRLALPARHLLAAAYRKKKYYMILERQRPVETLLTSRGCPFQCRFCSNIPARFRARSPENVMDEIVVRYDQGIRNFDIADANFTHDVDRAMAVFDLMIREKLNISFRFKSRTDVISERLVKRARQAGACLVSMGMESGSQIMLDRMHKRTIIDDNIQACRTVMQAGLKLNTGWILGFPGETPETLAQTINLIVGLKPTTANIGWLIPYPGTPVYEEAVEDKTLVGEWRPAGPGTRLPWIRLPWVRDEAHMRRIRQWAVKKVYVRPCYMINFTKEIVGNANFKLAAYAFQEGRKVIPGLFKRPVDLV